MFLIFEWMMYLILTIPDLRQDRSDGSEEVCHIFEKFCFYNSFTTLIALFHKQDSALSLRVIDIVKVCSSLPLLLSQL